MALWQELQSSSQDVSLDQDGYVHFTRTFRIIGGNPKNFFGSGTATAAFLSYSIFGVGTGTPPIAPQKMPDFGDVQKVGNGPASLIRGSSNEPEVIDQPVVLHAYTLRPGSAVFFDAIAHYTNDPRIAPLGIAYHTSEQQTFVNVPYGRSDPLIFNAEGSNPVQLSYSPAVHPQPMPVESISHTVYVPRKDILNAETQIKAHANEIHVLPVHGACLFLGADTRMHGVQWLEATYRWQWQQGIVNLSSVQPKTYNTEGQLQTGFIPVQIPTQVPSLIPNLTPHPMVLPPYHTIEMRFTKLTVSGITSLGCIWDLRCPYSFVPDGWKALRGSTKFIWSTP